MATSMSEPFEAWLTEKLTSVSPDFDTDVFVTYIIGILDTDDSDTDKVESLSELLEGVVESSVAVDTCKAIMKEWSANLERNKQSLPTEDIGDKLSEMFEKQTLATVKEKHLNVEEEARKAAILAQYGHVSEEEDVDDAAMPGGADVESKSKDTADSLLTRNTNKEDVSRVERAAREKAKQDSEKKKEKDRQDRQAQKQKQQERKETEKKRTQKGERRR